MKNVINKKLLGGVVIAGGLTFGGAAHATSILFDSVNDSYTANYNYTLDGATVSATVKYLLQSWNSTSAVFDITITNNTLASEVGQNAITAFGIDIVAPTLTGVSDDSATWVTDINKTFPGFQKVDFCAGTNGCSGGTINEGVFEGQSLNFDATLTTSGDFLNGITFTSPFVTKWQGVGLTGGSWEVDDSGGTDPDPPRQVPVPGTLLLIGLGLLGLRFRRQL